MFESENCKSRAKTLKADEAVSEEIQQGGLKSLQPEFAICSPKIVFQRGLNHKIYMIVAADEKNGIGRAGAIPWHFKKEMQYFAKITTATTDPAKKNMVLMGRTTWESLPAKYKPLPNRRNLVLTHQKDYRAQGAEVVDSLDKALILADTGTQNIFIIGGGQVFEQTINHPKLDGIYFTRIQKTYDCDTFFPEIPAAFKGKKERDDTESGISFSYLIYSK